jgi:glycosyltransferase involved in cell wall biosynthesis
LSALGSGEWSRRSICRSEALPPAGVTPLWRYAVTRKISLLVPLYNSSRYLDQLKRDIDHQTRPFDEVLMHDDGSADDTIEKAAGLGFEVIRGGPQKRQSHARNRLLAAASSGFVHFHDHDDPIHPQFVERMLPACSANGVAICHFAKTSPSGRTVFGHNFKNDYDLVFDNFVHLNAMVVCKDLARSVSGFDENLTLCEEKDFLFKVLRQGAQVTIVPELLAEWRIQDSSFMSSQGWTGAAVMLRRFIQNCLPNDSRKATELALEYALRAAWDYYYACPETITELREMFSYLSRRGLHPRTGLGTKAAFLIGLIGPVATLRLRRALSRKDATIA